MNKYYCYCPVCNKDEQKPDFWAKATSLQDAKEKLEVHEATCHKGKQVGTFGIGNTYPENMPKNV